MKTNWDLFVQKKTKELNSGASLPNYFGCLSNLIYLKKNQNNEILFDVPIKAKTPIKSEENRIIEQKPILKINHDEPLPAKAWEKTPSKSFSANVPKQQQKEEEEEAIENYAVQEEEEYTEIEANDQLFDQEKPRIDFSKEFRAISDPLFGKYWAPLDTIIPRFTLESKLMSTFKAKRYSKLFNTMNEKYATNGTNKLRFERKVVDNEYME